MTAMGRRFMVRSFLRVSKVLTAFDSTSVIFQTPFFLVAVSVWTYRDVAVLEDLLALLVEDLHLAGVLAGGETEVVGAPATVGDDGGRWWAGQSASPSP